MFAAGFVILALVLIPAMWCLYRPSRKIIEQTIKECNQLMNATATEDELLRAACKTPGTQKELLRAARADTPEQAEELLRAKIVQAAHDQPGETTTVQRLGQ
jgi:Arc/MetJ family transcription regulator